MSTEEMVEINVGEEAASESSPFALLFELEFVAMDSRQAAYDLLQNLLGEHRLELTPVLFSRYALHPSPKQYMPALLDALGAKKVNADKLATELVNGLAMYYSSNETALNPIAGQMLKLAQERGIALGVLSAQPEVAAEALIARLNLDADTMTLFAYDAAEHPVFPRADMWLKITKSLGRSPRSCVAMVGSSVSAKSALSSGMRCVALPDAFTAFQDFGGADAVLEDSSAEDLAELIELLYPEKS